MNRQPRHTGDRLAQLAVLQADPTRLLTRPRAAEPSTYEKGKVSWN